MMQREVKDTVLSNRVFVHNLLQWRPFTAFLIKWVLKIAMWAFFITWIAVYFLYPAEPLEGMFEKIFLATGGTFFGPIGGIFLVFSSQVIIIALLAAVYLTIFPRENHVIKKMKFSRFHLRAFPVFVNGPFGIVSAAELIGILMFAAFTISAAYDYTKYNIHLVSQMPLPSKEKSYKMLDYTGLRIGSIGLFCMGFLFLPITRGSILLQLIDVPFEQAARYHIWLGHLTMAMFTLHGLCYVVLWLLEGSFLHEIVRWQSDDIANLPGVIGLLVGLLMWVTSLNPVRKRYFELFYYTHQLYAVFIIFLALHVGDSAFSCAAGGIVLFIIDRFLRFWQSRRNVSVVSATCLPCGTVELVLSKPRGMRYNVLSFIFLRIRELSWLQWHPLSVSSSPLDGKHHLSVLIKVLGDWTSKLRENPYVSMQPQERLPCQPYTGITASVEGPYGHDSAYHLAYENLVLVAGGIGISPFLAILRDIMHRTRDNRCWLPKNVLLVWAVKRSKDLSLLSMIDPMFISPTFSEKVHLEIQTYVTQEMEPPLEEGNHSKSENYPFPMSTSESSMSGLVGTGNKIWSGIYLFSSTIGFIISFGLMEAFYITPFDVECLWFKGLLFVMSMIVSVGVFGGVVVFLWHQWERRASNHDKYTNDQERNTDLACNNDPKMQNNSSESSIGSMNTIHYGCRPNFSATFSSVSERWGRVMVGVIVCGPQGLQTSVASECRSRTIWRSQEQPIFHFNSHSFDL